MTYITKYSHYNSGEALFFVLFIGNRIVQILIVYWKLEVLHLNSIEGRKFVDCSMATEVVYIDTT